MTPWLLLAALQVEEWHVLLALGGVLATIVSALWIFGTKALAVSNELTATLTKIGTTLATTVERLSIVSAKQDEHTAALAEHDGDLKVLKDRDEREPREPTLRTRAAK